MEKVQVKLKETPENETEKHKVLEQQEQDLKQKAAAEKSAQEKKAQLDMISTFASLQVGDHNERVSDLANLLKFLGLEVSQSPEEQEAQERAAKEQQAEMMKAMQQAKTPQDRQKLLMKMEQKQQVNAGLKRELGSDLVSFLRVFRAVHGIQEADLLGEHTLAALRAEVELNYGDQAAAHHDLRSKKYKEMAEKLKKLPLTEPEYVGWSLRPKAMKEILGKRLFALKTKMSDFFQLAPPKAPEEKGEWYDNLPEDLHGWTEEQVHKLQDTFVHLGRLTPIAAVNAQVGPQQAAEQYQDPFFQGVLSRDLHGALDRLIQDHPEIKVTIKNGWPQWNDDLKKALRDDLAEAAKREEAARKQAAQDQQRRADEFAKVTFSGVHPRQMVGPLYPTGDVPVPDEIDKPLVQAAQDYNQSVQASLKQMEQYAAYWRTLNEQHISDPVRDVIRSVYETLLDANPTLPPYDFAQRITEFITGLKLESAKDRQTAIQAFEDYVLKSGRGKMDMAAHLLVANLAELLTHGSEEVADLTGATVKAPLDERSGAVQKEQIDEARRQVSDARDRALKAKIGEMIAFIPRVNWQGGTVQKNVFGTVSMMWNYAPGAADSARQEMAEFWHLVEHTITLENNYRTDYALQYLTMVGHEAQLKWLQNREAEAAKADRPVLRAQGRSLAPAAGRRALAPGAAHRPELPRPCLNIRPVSAAWPDNALMTDDQIQKAMDDSELEVSSVARARIDGDANLALAPGILDGSRHGGHRQGPCARSFPKSPIQRISSKASASTPPISGRLGQT